VELDDTLYRHSLPSRQITSILAIATGALIIDNFRFDFATVVARWDGRKQQAFCGADRNVRPLLIATTFFACFGVAWNLLATVVVAIVPAVQGYALGTDGSSVAWLALGVLLDLGDAAVAIALLSQINAWTIRFGTACDAVVVPAHPLLPPVAIVVHPAPLPVLPPSTSPLTPEYIIEASHGVGTSGGAMNEAQGAHLPDPEQLELPAAGIHLLADDEEQKPKQQLHPPSESQATSSAFTASENPDWSAPQAHAL